MPPKRPARQATPPSTKKPKKASKPAQPSIDSFFASPNKSAKAAARPSPKASNEVITIDDSDDDILPGSPPASQEAQDAKLARKLADEWAEGDVEGKGKKRGRTPEEGEKVKEEPLRTGVNGSSSSKKLLDPVKLESADTKVSPNVVKPVHPMFAAAGPSKARAPSPTPMRDVKPDLTSPKEAKSANITSTSAEAVKPIDFDTDAFLFRPAEVDISNWPKGRLPYSVLVGVYVQVSSTRSRLTIVRVLTKWAPISPSLTKKLSSFSSFLHLLIHASPIDLPPSLYLLSNHLLPSYLPCELGIGSQILSKAIQEVSGCQPRDLKKLWEKWGDPGDVAYEAKSTLRTLVTPAPLLVGDVYKRLLGLSKVKGTQSGKVKGDVVRKLMVQARGEEVRFLVRSLIGNLRTLLTSLARATALFHCPPDLISSVRPLPGPIPKAEKGQKRVPRPKVEPDLAREEVEARCVEATKLVRKVYVRHPNYADLVRGLEGHGLEGLEERVPVSVGIPLSPMLGSITRSLNEVFTRLGNLPFTAEAKLDGQRVQIHARLDGPQGEEDGGGRWVTGEEGQKAWVRLFSRYVVSPSADNMLSGRHLEDMTEKYPDICQLVLQLLYRPVPADPASFPSSASAAPQRVIDLLRVQKISSFIMDAEVVAVDKDSGAYRTFQDLSNRAKKDVRVEDIKVVVSVFAFDLMSINDETLLNSPFSHRRHILHALFPPHAPADPTQARFAHVESLDSTDCTDTPAEIQAFFEMVVEQKCEGLMVKLLESGEGLVGEDEEVEDDGAGEKVKRKKGAKGKDGEEGEVKEAGKGGKKKPLPATYEPDQRSQGWLKVKKDYLEGLGDSLDLVPIGAWWGQGRKAGWWSPILLACHNPETGALEAVCKCISGFTDAFYKDLLVRFPPHNAIPEKCNTDTTLGYYETNGLRPNVWFEPSEVWEIRGADITLSPVYPAAASLLGSERGLSMRFPRFMKRRDDKSWEQASTSQQFADMYRRQIKEAPAREKAGAAAAAGGAEIIRQGSEEVKSAADEEGEVGDEDEQEDEEDFGEEE